MSQSTANRTVETGTTHLLCRIEDGVAVLTLNRPESRNALSMEMTPALRRLLLELAADREVGCLVLTGAGRAFCAGGDVKGMAQRNSAEGPPVSVEENVQQLRMRQAEVSAAIHELNKPVIAALPGPAAGAGLSIALACDLRIAAESAFISTAFVNIGFSGDFGGSWFLTQLVGPAKARELYFTGDRVDARECERLGIFNRVVPDATLESETTALAQRIASGPRIALAYMKENLNRALTQDLRTCLELEAEHMVRTRMTEDHREAVKAFIEKRRPVFRGR
jgi:enoyl-CoA hydratase/carnithine racemase